MSSLCFREALVKRKNNEITEDEYLQALVNHCTGVCHGVNKLCNDDAVLPADTHPGDAFGYDINDPFTWAVAQWIYYKFGTPVEDTTPIFDILKAFRTSNVQQFKSGLYELEKAQYGLYRRRSLCSRLATIALENRDAAILKAILEVHGDSEIEWFFHRDFDTLKHEGRRPEDEEIIRIVENSSFQSMVRPGERFNAHPLDLL